MKEEISTAKNKLQYKFLLLLSTAYLASGVNTQGFLALMPFVRNEFEISRAQAGLYSTCFFLTATIIAIFAGRIVDKIGSKKGMIFGTASVGIMIFFHAIAPYFYVILIFSFLTGIVFSIITPSLNKAVMKKVKPENRATSMGIMQSGGGIGGVLGASLLPLLGGIFGWRRALLFSGVFAICLSLFIYRFYVEEDDSDVDSDNDISFKESISILLKNKYLLVVCGLGLGLGTSIGAVPAHYTLYLTQDLEVSTSIAGFCLGILHIGGIIGRPGWGWINDKFLNGNRRLGLILAGLTFTIIALFYSIYITNYNPSLMLIYISSFILGIISMGWMGIFFTTIAELVSEELTGIGTGFALIFTRTGVVLSPPIFGYIADVTGSYSSSWLAVGLVIFVFTLAFIILSRKFKKVDINKKSVEF